jgi:hypothetical protein
VVSGPRPTAIACRPLTTDCRPRPQVHRPHPLVHYPRPLVSRPMRLRSADSLSARPGPSDLTQYMLCDRFDVRDVQCACVTEGIPYVNSTFTCIGRPDGRCKVFRRCSFLAKARECCRCRAARRDDVILCHYVQLVLIGARAFSICCTGIENLPVTHTHSFPHAFVRNDLSKV